MKFVLVLAAALGLHAQGGLDFPRVGEILDTAGSVRELRGLAGAFTLGPSKYDGAISIGCNGRFCLAKTAEHIVSQSSTEAAPAGPAIFGFEGDRALIYFPESRRFARWDDSGLEMLDWNVDGEVLAVRPRGDDADIVVRRGGEVWISEIGGHVRGSLPWDTVAALLLPSGVVYAGSDTVVVSTAGVVRSLTVAAQKDAAERLRGEAMSRAREQADTPMLLYELDANHAVARADRHLFLIAVDRGEIFELPGGDQ